MCTNTYCIWSIRYCSLVSKVKCNAGMTYTSNQFKDNKIDIVWKQGLYISLGCSCGSSYSEIVLVYLSVSKCVLLFTDFGDFNTFIMNTNNPLNSLKSHKSYLITNGTEFARRFICMYNKRMKRIRSNLNCLLLLVC